jgi:coenzyme PQQ synthesis protein D (PqqD)
VPLTELSRVVVAKNLVSRDLAGEIVILNLQNGVYYGINPVGARVWNLVQELRTFAEVRDTLLEEYDVEAGCLEADLRLLLAQLAEGGLVEITA